MTIGKRIGLALLVLPAAEILAFIMVAAAIGWAGALALMAATSLLGYAMLRRAGASLPARFHEIMSADGPAAALAASGGPITALAGILLLLPGFITDIAGLALLAPMVRRRLGATIRRAGSAPERRRGSASVVDLGREEWRRIPDPELPANREG